MIYRVLIRINILVIIILLATGISSQAQEITTAKDWLTSAIKDYFDVDAIRHFRDFTTDRYAEYKQDAICVVYDCDNSLTVEQFEQKWSKIYDISYAGIGESFLTGQQDHGIVVMPKCELISQENNEIYIFDTVITDTLGGLTYLIEITVVKTKSGFKIDDLV
jgi:hypothetical protein